MAVDGGDEFQRELITLFVQEAHEWLQQIHVALDELQQGPPAERHVKLASSMKAGLTNLGGSAATVSLLEVEQASFAAIPFVEAVENPSEPLSASAFLILCKQLGQIQGALTKATGEGFETDSGGCSGNVPLTMPAEDLLTGLKAVHRRSESGEPVRRNVTQTVISQIEGLLKSGVAQCDVNALRGFLARVADEEQVFLDTVQHEGPLLLEGVEGLGRLMPLEKGPVNEGSALAERAGTLWSASQQANAAAAMTFFSGLQGFLSMIGSGRACPDSRQFERVRQRLGQTLDQLRAWVEAGRVERRAIEELLPA